MLLSIEASKILLFISVLSCILSIVIRRMDEEDYLRRMELSWANGQSNSKGIRNLSKVRRKRIAEKISLAGYAFSPDKFQLYKVMSALLLALITLITLKSFFIALAAAAAGFYIPDIWLGNRRSQREKLLRLGFPEILERLANSMDAGASLQSALENAKDNCLEPWRTEIEHILANINRGEGEIRAFKRAARERISLDEFQRMAFAVSILKNTGGNMALNFRNISQSIKDQQELLEEIDTNIMQNRVSSYIIGVIPIGMFIIFMFLAPDYVETALKNTYGQIGYLAAFTLTGIGVITARGISNMEKHVQGIISIMDEEGEA